MAPGRGRYARGTAAAEGEEWRQLVECNTMRDAEEGGQRQRLGLCYAVDWKRMGLMEVHKEDQGEGDEEQGISTRW